VRLGNWVTWLALAGLLLERALRHRHERALHHRHEAAARQLA